MRVVAVGQGLKIPVRVLDGVGASLVGACAVAAMWLLMVRFDQTTERLDGLNGLIRTALDTQQSIHAATVRQAKGLARVEGELALRGHLPAHAPVEAYFEALATVARRHGLRVVRHSPVGSRRYPGLLEQRFQYEVSGPGSGVLTFLKAIEESRFWADVGYLRIHSGNPTTAGGGAPRVALLTISLFSALPPEASGAATGGGT